MLEPTPGETADHPPQQVRQAVGEIILLHNDLASSLFVYFHHYLKLPTSVRGFLFDTLNNKARVDLLTRLASGAHPDDLEAISYALKCFNICTENRNIIAHSTYERALKDGRHLFKKEATSVTPSMWRYALTADDLTATGTQISGVLWYTVFLWGSLKSRGNVKHMPLPGRPPQPRKLSLFRIEEVPEGD